MRFKGLFEYITHLTIMKQWLVAAISASYLSTIHILLGILIGVINLAILIPIVIQTYTKKHDKKTIQIKSTSNDSE